jgi:hypothetical protein
MLMQEIKMDINKVLKMAIRDVELRKSLVAHPVETCRNLGVEVNGLPYNIAGMQPVMAASPMQGGYRP